MSQKDLLEIQKVENVEDMVFDLPRPQPIRGFPELHWAGKRPFTSTHFFPAQLKERYGDPVDGWMNRIYWGDNLQVMSHLLKEFRGKVDLIYIDPPFDSKAEYKKTITLKGKSVKSDINSFEEKQYGDLWANDDYLQFIYERLIIIKELLSENGLIYLHCDWHKGHILRSLLDEVFGPNNFINQIVWKRSSNTSSIGKIWKRAHDLILFYKKGQDYIFNQQKRELSEASLKIYSKEDKDGRKYRVVPLLVSGKRNGQTGKPWHNIDPNKLGKSGMHWVTKHQNLQDYEDNNLIEWSDEGIPGLKYFLDEHQGVVISDLWDDINLITSTGKQSLSYPTQKPEELLERIILASTNSGSLVLDCFMGSGTTQAVAMKLGRRFIGADINLGAIQTTTKRLIGIIKEKKKDRDTLIDDHPLYLNFEVYNVNNYDIFRNPVEAKDLLVQALEIEKLDNSDIFDGMKDGYKVKIMPVNRIATRKDLNPIISGMNYRELDKIIEKNPNAETDRIMLVCMGHEPDLAARLKIEIGPQYNIDVKVIDILREKERGLTFKYDAEADIAIESDELVIRQFFPRNLLQKLSLLDENVEDWRELAESVQIDWNYNGEVFRPGLNDMPGKKELVKGRYKLPPDYGDIRVKITDLLSENLEMTIGAE